jgi:uncharacterized protein (TIGR02246 family)
MRQFVSGLLLLLLAATANGQSKTDEEAVRKLSQAFCDAWAKHDGHELANIMADDVDFVTVGADWFHGRADFEKYHVRLLSGRFKASIITPLQTEARFLGPDSAVVHWSWRIEADKNYDGSTRQPRYGVMVMVAAKRNSFWLVVAAQNTQFAPDLPPELEGIKSHAVFPPPDKKP